jgi:hypothetical protein
VIELSGNSRDIESYYEDFIMHVSLTMFIDGMVDSGDYVEIVANVGGWEVFHKIWVGNETYPETVNLQFDASDWHIIAQESSGFPYVHLHYVATETYSAAW